MGNVSPSLYVPVLGLFINLAGWTMVQSNALLFIKDSCLGISAKRFLRTVRMKIFSGKNILSLTPKDATKINLFTLCFSIAAMTFFIPSDMVVFGFQNEVEALFPSALMTTS